MHRCFVAPPAWRGAELYPSDEESHHLLHVLRADIDDEVIAFDGQGRQVRAKIVQAEPLVMEVLEQNFDNTAASVRILLFVAIPKGKRMDLIVEKCTELGVTEIIPVLTDRVISRPKSKQAEEKVARWNRVALSAAKQCGTSWLPEVKQVTGYTAAIEAAAEADLFVVGALTPDARSLKGVLRESVEGGEIRTVSVLIGPEGDFTDSELSEAIDAGAKPVSFGELVLRVETAAIHAVSALRYEITA